MLTQLAAAARWVGVGGLFGGAGVGGRARKRGLAGFCLHSVLGKN